MAIFLITTALIFSISSFIIGIKEIIKIENKKEKNEKTIWITVSLIGIFVGGLGMLIPLMHASLNENEKGIKKIMFCVAMTIMSIVGILVLYYTSN